MITHDARRSLSRGNNPVLSPWQATRRAVGASAPRSSSLISDLRITSVFSCAGREFKARASFRFIIWLLAAAVGC